MIDRAAPDARNGDNEVPESPELRIDTTMTSAEDAAERIVLTLRARGILAP